MNKNRTPDPHQAREAHKYDYPIASREHILEVLARHGEPMPPDALAETLALTEGRDFKALRRRLRAMVRDGQLLYDRRSGYGPGDDERNLITGTLSAHRGGYGFVIPDGGGGDLYLASREMSGLMHGDRVTVRLSGVDAMGRREGVPVEVLARGATRLVGRVWRESGAVFVRPDDPRFHHDITLERAAAAKIATGQVVVVDITRYPSQAAPAKGEIARVLGDPAAPGMEIQRAIHRYQLPDQWPQEALAQAAACGDRVMPDAHQGREDLRHLHLVTIDGEDARDFDDAVCCKATPGGWKLWVAIADVSAYVAPDSALDLAARERGNSVYFLGQVVPMLPEALSNGLCSLNPEVERLCLVCEMQVSHAGEVRRFRFYPGLMCSRARLTYTEVAAAVAGDGPVRAGLGPLCPYLDELHRLYRALAGERARRGAMDIDMPEAAITLDGQGKIAAITPRYRNDAHRMIEECMIAANVCAARYLQQARLPCLYRIHDGPGEEKLRELRDFLKELGLNLAGRGKPRGWRLRGAACP